jgi:DNA-binding response OmpR family regulator
MNVELFEAALETDGHAVVTERDGAAGERRGSDEKFDLILLDIQLPKRSGLDVCRGLRSRKIATPIVALSASVLPEEVARTHEAGFDLFLSKPIAPADLRAVVRQMSTLPQTEVGRRR